MNYSNVKFVSCCCCCYCDSMNPQLTQSSSSNKLKQKCENEKNNGPADENLLVTKVIFQLQIFHLRNLLLLVSFGL